jgi:hypothetical protein
MFVTAVSQWAFAQVYMKFVRNEVNEIILTPGWLDFGADGFSTSYSTSCAMTPASFIDFGKGKWYSGSI